MRTITLICIFSFASAVPAIFGQVAPTVKGTSDSTMEWGTIKDGKFVSTRLGLTLPIPAHFSVLSSVESEMLADSGSDLMKEGIVSEKQFDAAIARTIRLLAITEKPVGSPENSALEVVTVKQQKGITANMALAANVALLKGSPYVLKRSLTPLKLGTHTFSGAELEGTFGEVKVTQRMYVIMHKGYSIVFASVYLNDKQRTEMEKILSAVLLK